MKGYKTWNIVARMTIYIWDVVFRDIKEDPIQDVTPMEKELEKIYF